MSSWPSDNASVEEDVRIFPASFFQESLWFHDQLEPNRAAYNISSCFRLRGLLNVSVLEQVLHTLVQRHEILRTTFRMLEGQLVQVISPTQFIALQIVDLCHLPQTEQEAEAQRLAAAEAQRPFDLTHGPLLRTTLLQLAAEEHMLLLTIHHIIFDDWSMGVLCQELSALYMAFLHDQPSPLLELPIQYADFAVWQRQWLQGEVLATQLSYWRQQLSGVPALLELPTDHPRPAAQTFRGAQHRFMLPQELADALKALSRRKEVTLFMTVLAAFKVLLCRYTGQTDVVVGSPLANRNRSGTEGLIGLFENILVLHTDLSENPFFEQVLRRVGEVVLAAYAHQDLPFEKLVEQLNPERTTSHHPLFQVLFTLQSDPLPTFNLPGLHLQLVEIKNETAKFDLSLTLKDTGQGLIGTWEYSTDLFGSATISRMGGHFQTLLESIVVNPEQPIPELQLLTAAERQQLLVEWNATQTRYPYPLEQCLHQLFEAQVKRTPKAVAVVCEGDRLSYQELNAHANRLAHQLREHGVRPESLVALLAERGIPFLISILAVFKAGGAYLPLDPHHPPTRLRQVIELSQCTIVLAMRAFAPTLTYVLEEVPAEQSPEPLYYEEVLQASQSEENLLAYSTPRDLAYVIYTSGSTGQPKGAMVEQRGMVNHIYAKIEALTLTDQDTVAQTASQCFVISVWQFLAALLVGGRVQIYPDEVAHNPVQLLTQVEHHQISILETVPSLMRAMLSADQIKVASRPKLEALRWLIPTGEALPVELCQHWLRSYPHAPLLNAYGSSESSDDVAHYPIYEAPEEMRGSVPIGRVIPNMRLYVLDRHLEPLPIGVSGELYVGGIGVGRGYLGDEKRTKEAFVADPFGSEDGAQLYKTGDLVRYLPDGNLELLGRLDFQVKLRGMRIELGEIEAVLMQHPGVEQAVVIAREDVLDDKHLVAYIVPYQGQAVDVSDLRSHVMNQLPTYMVPSAFVLLEMLPLTYNGKVDRRALPAPEYTSSGLESSLVMPQTPLQEAIAASWTQVLGIAQVGIHDNFFTLGGHSLTAMQVLSRLRRGLQVELPLHRFFTAPTIAQLSEMIEQMKASEALLPLSAPHPLPREAHRMRLSSLLSTQDSRSFRSKDQRSIQMSPWSSDNASPEEDVYIFPASFFQESLWLHDQLDPSRAVYTIPCCFRLRGLLNVSILEQVLHTLVQRHETLRTTFLVFEGQLVQVVSPTLSIPLQMLDLRNLSQAEQEAEAQRLVTVEVQRPFDLTGGPLLRTTLLQLAAEEHMLLLTIHHIIFDDWSMDVLCQELAALYTAFVHDQPSPLLELPIQYADFAVWQRQRLQGDVLATQISYWRQQLSGAPALLELPTDHPRPAVQAFRSAQHRFVLSQELADALKELSRRKGITLFITLLAAFNVLLYRYTGQTDIVVGSPIANRNHTGMESLIGFFLNMLVLRTDLSENPSFDEVLRRVGKVTLGAYAHQDLPFEKLVEQLNPERNMSYNPLFQVLFTLRSDLPLTSDLPGLHLQLVEIDEAGKFDLGLALKDTEHGLVGAWRYNADLFEPATISRMGDHFQTLLEGLVVNSEQFISELPLLTVAERQQLLVQWNATQTAYPKHRCVHQLFEEQVERTPEAVAVVCEQERLTYAELNQQANQVACYLRKLGVGPEARVGLCMQRSIDMVVGLLGILKAGGVYVPLDPAYPQERLTFMLESSQVAVLLLQHCFSEKFVDCKAHIVSIDTEWDVIAQESSKNPVSEVVSDNLIYVIYTSGSTGRPKGAGICHRSFINLLHWFVTEFSITNRDRFLLISSLNFDLTQKNIFAPLLVGGTLSLLNVDHYDPTVICQSIVSEQPTIINCAPSAFYRIMNEAGKNSYKNLLPLRYLFLGGEPVHIPRLQQWMNSAYFKAEIVNTYGPTECTDVCSFYRLDPSKQFAEASPPIGKPIFNTKLLILDESLNLMPVGVAGELYVGGDSVGMGYIEDSELTARKFIPDPFSDKHGARLYQTGDLARYLPDGNIEFLGRIDNQVKIRGYRIELGEIEAVLTQHSHVQAAVVVAREDMLNDERLVAYIVPHQGRTVNVSDLQGYVMKRLPIHIVPSAFVLLEAFPLMPNGKVDRRALPAPEAQRPELQEAFTSPRTPLEEMLATIWSQVLGLERVGVHDKFFELGGDSIKAVTIVNRLQELLGEVVYVVALFDAPSIAQLSTYLSKHYRLAVEKQFGVASLSHPTEEYKAMHQGDESAVDGVEQLRRLIKPLPPRKVVQNQPAIRNPSAIFILSPPRSGSTLLRTMLGGHPRLFAPPELELLSFNTLHERATAFSGRNSFWLEGAMRAIMEIKGCDAETAKSLMDSYENLQMTTQQFYRILQQEIGEKTLVDKTPSYAMDIEILRRAEADFTNARYIHLLRHPYGMIQSGEEAKLEQVFFRYPHTFTPRELAELIWLVSQQNICAFLEEVPADRQYRLRFEELVQQPEIVMEKLCSFLQLEYHPDMVHPYKGQRMTDGIHKMSRMLGDVKFHSHHKIEAHIADRWKASNNEKPLREDTWAMAEALGYIQEEAGQSALSSPQRNLGRDEVRRESMIRQQQIRQKRKKI